MLPAESSPSALRSLNVPLSHLFDCRYMIPIFAAPYYEASIIPVPGGNLPESQPGGPAVKGTLKIWFKEGGGSAFREAVEEVRGLARGTQPAEQLRKSLQVSAIERCTPGYMRCLAFAANPPLSIFQ